MNQQKYKYIKYKKPKIGGADLEKASKEITKKQLKRHIDDFLENIKNKTINQIKWKPYKPS